MNIGEKIKTIRKSKGITQKKLSEETGIAEITIRQYEAGKYIPKIDKIELISKALEVDISEFDTRLQTLENSMLNLTNLREKEKVLTKIISENTDAQSYTQLLFELSSIKEEIRKTEKNINLIQSSFQGEEMEKIKPFWSKRSR